MKAIGNHGRALEFTSERLRGDFELVVCACANEGSLRGGHEVKIGAGRRVWLYLVMTLR